MGENNIAYVPPVDSVAEFRIQTNSYDAQYRHTTGGIVNVSTKSGTNELHGSVYGFWKRPSWSANLFQNNAYGRERPNTTLNLHGFQVGGPVFVPKVFDGRNKLFFMVNFEDWREDWAQPLQRSVPQPELLTGDFSKLVNPQGQQIRIFDPLTATAANNYTRSPFPVNTIPANRLNPIAQNVLRFFPAPNTTSPGRNYGENNFFDGENVAKDRFYNLLPVAVPAHQRSRDGRLGQHTDQQPDSQHPRIVQPLHREVEFLRGAGLRRTHARVAGLAHQRAADRGPLPAL